MSHGDRQNPKRVILVGAAGRMGKEVSALIDKDPDLVLSGSIHRSEDWTKIKEADGVVDFSTPEGFRAALQWCVDHGTPFVSGTTGLGDPDFRQLQEASKRIPVLYSPNMSLGVAVLMNMMRELARVRDWDFELSEIHHVKKVDRPSGTARMLQDHLHQILNRSGVPVHSLRGGGVPGTHTVFAFGPDETIELKHEVFQRSVFARGAIRALRWLFDKKLPGLYDLNDLY